MKNVVARPDVALTPIIASLLFIRWLFFNAPVSRKNLPPSPSRLPVLGNFHQLGLLPHRNLQSLAHKHGPIMLLHFESVPTLLLSSADAAREVMKIQELKTGLYQVFSGVCCMTGKIYLWHLMESTGGS